MVWNELLLALNLRFCGYIFIFLWFFFLDICLGYLYSAEYVVPLNFNKNSAFLSAVESLQSTTHGFQNGTKHEPILL